MSDYEVRQSPIPGVVDILMHVGLVYDVPRYINETMLYGASKRISLSSIPEGLVPGVSFLYLWHSHVIPFVTSEEHTFRELVEELLDLDLLYQPLDEEDLEWAARPELSSSDPVPPGILAVTCAIQENIDHRLWLQEKYGIRWQGGVFLSTPLGKLRYILKKDETELPEHLQPYAHLIDAVRVVRVDDDGNPLDNQNDGDELEED